MPGMIQRPRASTSCAPAGIDTARRGPTAVMRAPSTTMTASGIGGPPWPSMSVAPTIADRAAGDWAARCPSANARHAPARVIRVRWRMSGTLLQARGHGGSGSRGHGGSGNGGYGGNGNGGYGGNGNGGYGVSGSSFFGGAEERRFSPLLRFSPKKEDPLTPYPQLPLPP